MLAPHLSGCRTASILGAWLLLVATTLAASTPATTPGACASGDESACRVPAAGAAGTGSPGPANADEERRHPVLLFFWAVACPHCEEAKTFLQRLRQEHPGVQIESVEVRENPTGRARFVETMQRLGVVGSGVPAFIVGRRSVVGFQPGVTEEKIRQLIELEQPAGGRTISLPWLGEIDPARFPFPVLTLLIGLVDGLNPCAVWVLVVMLGVLLHAGSRLRLLLFGGTFVAMSGVVYFLFMTAWLGLFTLGGLSRELTRGLGAALLVMGLINLKEIVWFKQGPSLMVPDRAKPGLFRRIRAVAAAASLPAALLGIAALAFVVNLIELGCTIGLPAVYTRILTLRGDLTWPSRYAYLALYNAAYVVPLACVVLVYALTLHRLALGERGAKVLKAISGALLVGFGLLFALAPQVLG